VVAVVQGAALGFFHDVVVTENYYILIQNPTRMDIRSLLLECVFGRKSIAECIVYDAALPARVHAVPRPGRGHASADVKVLLPPRPL
jgi:all-trans-8'-apo-beta-carotenal 15,15'-oxygenase